MVSLTHVVCAGLASPEASTQWMPRPGVNGKWWAWHDEETQWASSGCPCRPRRQATSSGFRREYDLPVRVPGLSLWHRSQAARLRCQFVTPPSNPARNGRGTSAGRDAGVVSGRVKTVASTLAPGSRHLVPSGGLTARWGIASPRAVFMLPRRHDSCEGCSTAVVVVVLTQGNGLSPAPGPTPPLLLYAGSSPP